MTEIIERKPTPEELAEVKAWEAGAYDREIAEVKAQRQLAYQAEADPIFFQMQRDANFKQEDWHAKILEIEERYPYPEPPKK